MFCFVWFHLVPLFHGISLRSWQLINLWITLREEAGSDRVTSHWDGSVILNFQTDTFGFPLASSTVCVYVYVLYLIFFFQGCKKTEMDLSSCCNKLWRNKRRCCASLSVKRCCTGRILHTCVNHCSAVDCGHGMLNSVFRTWMLCSGGKKEKKSKNRVYLTGEQDLNLNECLR